ncbi:hypothetical protein CspHIS471_0200720 [Cutaneotrichosporon sp. HIS471]|nr:hypothetical protein CspHIS471_0200720 [Cutaneotrichosporon sp. HIS471]
MTTASPPTRLPFSKRHSGPGRNSLAHSHSHNDPHRLADRLSHRKPSEAEREPQRDWKATSNFGKKAKSEAKRNLYAVPDRM